MKKKKVIVISTLLLAIVLLGIGTIAYFRRTVNGTVTGQAGNLVLIVNEANAEDSESFNIVLQRSKTEAFVMPDDSGVFNVNIDASGSSSDVAATITIARISLPENLKFYLDSNHTQELTTYRTVIKKADTMTKTIPIYWFWDGSINDEDDSNFINTTISANVSVNATFAKTVYDTLLSLDNTLDTNVDFSLGASETNGQGLMMMNSTQTSDYPILYYRGNVSNNNVVYAGFCWLIVRTTETGGTKLIYNGEINDDGSCNNYSGVNGKTITNNSEKTFIGKSPFNNLWDSPVYVGYMYNDTNKFFTHSAEWTGTHIDANGVLDISTYVEHLEDNTVDTLSGKHIQNLKNSNIKNIIDNWYLLNIYEKEEENLLEDTVWCNDRTITSNNFPLNNYANNKKFVYSSYTRNFEINNNIFSNVTPSVVCPTMSDSFTVSEKNGNGDLTYPIGLLTTDEVLISGNLKYSDINNITYLSVPLDNYWLLSPGAFDNGIANSLVLDNSGIGYDKVVRTIYNIRPSVSLGLNAYIVQGNGTFENPYIISG